MYKLYWGRGGANMAPHAVLEEIGAPFELVELDFDRNEHKAAEYLQLNPNGRVPTLIHDGKAIYESAAILLYLCERHPEAKSDAPARLTGARPLSAVAVLLHQHGAGGDDALVAR